MIQGGEREHTIGAEKRLKEFKGEIDVFVPKDQEQAYLAQHGIEIHHLSNGALVAGATRHVEDAADASIRVHFPSAAYYEPVGKRGVSHMLEHFMFNEPHFLAEQVDAFYNARTSAVDMEMIMQGKSHLQVRDYGIWPVVPVALDMVTKPLEVTEEALESEKGVIIGEMYRHRVGASNADYRASLLERVLFLPDNPRLYHPIGTEEEVRNFSTADVQEYHDKVCIPRGLTATVFVEGSTAMTEELLQTIESQIGSMPDEGREPATIDKSLYNALNPAYQQGATYVEDSGKHDGQVQICYTWLLPSTSFSVQTFAESRFFNVAQKRMFQWFRRKGHGYEAQPITIDIGDDKRILGFALSVPKNAQVEQFAQAIYPSLKEATFEGFNDDDIEYIDTIEHKRSAATPTTVAVRFSNAMTGLLDHGRIIDPDQVRILSQNVQPTKLKAAQEIFLSTRPTVLIEGDLS